jgi:hypothetical protein
MDQNSASRRLDAELAAGAVIGCIQNNVGTDMIDQYQCACGWRSKPYYDGAEYAHADWVSHIKAKGAAINYASTNIPTPLDLLESTLTSLERGEIPLHEWQEEIDVAHRQISAARVSYRERQATGRATLPDEADQIDAKQRRLDTLRK